MRLGKRIGFTMVELAIVLIIMGVIGTLFYDVINSFIAREKVEASRRAAEVAGNQIVGYVLGEDGELPEADATSPTSVDSFFPESLGTYNDVWGNEMRYWPATTSEASTTPIDVDDETSTILELHIWEGLNPASVTATNPLGGTTETVISNVAYVIGSDGQNGSAQTSVRQGSIEVHVADTGTDMGDGTTFDDVWAYKTLAELKVSRNTVANSESDTDPPGTPALNLDFSDGSYDPSNLTNGATVVQIPDASGTGTIDVLNLDGVDDYLDLSDRSDSYLFNEYTIMGWYKTDTATQTGSEDFDVITTRQINSTNRTWWVVLWANGYLTQGGGKFPGELSMKARTTANQDFNVDLACDDRDTDGNSTCHDHDTQWHFFSVSMKKRDDDKYEVSMIVSEGAAGARTLQKTEDADSDYVRNDGPKTNTNYKIYVGYDQQNSNRHFGGQISQIVFYDYAVDEADIEDFFDRVEGDYP